jgi:hypothetical protein
MCLSMEYFLSLTVLPQDAMHLNWYFDALMSHGMIMFMHMGMTCAQSDNAHDMMY